MNDSANPSRPTPAFPLRAASALLLGVMMAGELAAAQPDRVIGAADRREVIEHVVQALDSAYVFPDMAARMTADLRARAQRGEYDRLDSATAFADKMTSDLRSISHDRHLRLRYRHEEVAGDQANSALSAGEIARYAREAKASNYGFRKVEILDGNVGYLRFDEFVDPGLAAPAATAALSLLANSSALIIDLRHNGGGSPEMVQFISSYLFEGEPVHLNDLYYRPQNSTTQYWTHAWVPGTRMPATPVYVLTGKKTFSAAEEFTYNLKNLKRATIVGETTGGGAHPGDYIRVHPHFQVFVPNGRAINPVSKTNWEGTGVTPDVAVAAPAAFDRAYRLALEAAAKSGEAASRSVAEAALARLGKVEALGK